jgi:hypothetical protein
LARKSCSVAFVLDRQRFPLTGLGCTIACQGVLTYLGSLNTKFSLNPSLRQKALFQHATTQVSTRAKASYEMGREKGPFCSFRPKIDSSNRSNEPTNCPQTALKPVPIGPLSESTKFDDGHLRELPDYHPPLDLRYKPFESIATGLSVIQTFLLFFTQSIVDIIVLTINVYTAGRRRNRNERKGTRDWKSVNLTDIWRYLGCLLYIGETIKSQYSVY